MISLLFSCWRQINVRLCSHYFSFLTSVSLAVSATFSDGWSSYLKIKKHITAIPIWQLEFSQYSRWIQWTPEMCHYAVWYIGTNISAYCSTPKMEAASCTWHHIPEGCALQHKYLSHHVYPTSNTLKEYLIMLGCLNEVIMDWAWNLEIKIHTTFGWKHYFKSSHLCNQGNGRKPLTLWCLTTPIVVVPHG